LIIQTREQGNSPLYKLNIDNKLVQVILKFDFEIAKKIADIESKQSVKKYSSALARSNKKISKQKAAMSN
jgi:hypothetical protein